MKNIGLHALFDPATSTLTYILWDLPSRAAMVIDPVLDFDPATQLTSRRSLNDVQRFLKSENLRLEWIFETHAHADHLSSARELRALWPGSRWALSHRMGEVFATFHKLMAWPKTVTLKGLGVDRWLEDGEEIALAENFRVQALATPGHTPACMTFAVGGWLFTGDALMMPDGGVGRCDFPGGSATALYDSVWSRLYARPRDSQVFVGHDYSPGGRPLRYRTTLGEEMDNNIHLRESTSRADFVAFRTSRDKTLSAPRLLNPSLDWNLGAHQIIVREK